MAFIYHVCSTRAYLRCIVAINTDSSLHGLTIIRRHLPRDPSMNIHPLYANGLCMLLIHCVWHTHIRIVKCPCYITHVDIRSDTVNHHTFTSAEHGYHTRSGNSASYSRFTEICICQLNWRDFHYLSPACSTAYGSIVCIVPTHNHIHHHHHRRNYMSWQLVRCDCSALWI